MGDPVKYALWIGGVGLVAMIVAAGYVLLSNSGSRNLALGFGTLAGACVIFIIQIFFELKAPSATAVDFPIEFSIDLEARAIRSPSAYQPVYSGPLRNVMTEIMASEILAGKSVNKDDAPKVARDLAIVSFLAFLADEQPDWQLSVLSYRTTLGTTMQWQSLSKESERTRINGSFVREELKRAGNMFAEMGNLGMRDAFDLPPGASVQIDVVSVRLRTNIATVEFVVQEPFQSMHSIDPHEMIDAVRNKRPVSVSGPTLSDGKTPRYLNVTLGGRVNASFSALRAQAGDLLKYQAWAKRLVEGVQSRFAPVQ